MQHWSWNNYVMLLGLKGYDVRERQDSKGILHGYTLRKGNVIIKASELRGRAFMVSRLENTWRRLHTQKNTDTQVQKTPRTSTATNTDASRTTTHQPQPTSQQSNRPISSASQSSAPSVAQPSKMNYATLIDYTRYRPDTIPYTLEHDGKERRYYIPEKVMDLFNDEFDHRKTANWQELTNLAVALFVGMAGGPATSSPSGGGGSSADNNWGRDKDEDDLRWARRCVKAATRKLGKQPKYGLRR